MPVEPIPCTSDSGGGTPGACACAPSIATTPLCRADGTAILVVVRSPCTTCGTPPPAPQTVGWIDPTTGTFTPGLPPADAGPCTTESACSCAPSITTMPLCRPDGTTIALLIASPCTTCGTPAPDPTVIGWVDPTTGTFTPGPAPADAGPCTTDCVDTVCRQRCDDTTGDGQADTLYHELWCIAPDGTATLLLTYANDPATPYTPVSPVECQHGTVDCHTVELCDDTGAFLRRYRFISDGTASFEDVALDGQTPHLVTGPVRACADQPGCDQPTTPTATVGLCLADGTPIAAVVVRDCAGVTEQAGWLNLTTGAWSNGAPPSGTRACGQPRNITTSGTWCDTDPTTGDVHGLVLIEYTYDPDGAVTGVRLVDATTGQPYTPQGTVTVCPAGVDQPEQDVVQLCDRQADGTVTPFVRDFRRDENGAIVGHTDYTLDGQPYTPTGVVGTCSQPCPVHNVIRAERCDDTTGDGIADVWYVELLGVDCTGTLTPLGTYTCDLTAPYQPTAPVDCEPDTEPAGAAPVVFAQARRAQLTPGATWSAAAHPLLRAVEATAHGGTGQITTADGTTTLHQGETARWTARDSDAMLTGPLTITAATGTISINYTLGVTS